MPTLHTSRLVLRPYRQNDWEAFWSLVQDDDLMSRLSGALTSESSRALLERLIQHDPATGVLGWAVVTRHQHEYCGHVFINNRVRDERAAELGFVLLKKFHGQGLAVEMATAAHQYARTQLGCLVVSATVDEDNTRSRAVLERIEMSIASRELDADGAYLVYSDAGG